MINWLASIVAPLNHVLFTVGNDAVSWAELLGFVTGAACVYLTVRAHVANFPVGIVNSALFLVLFLSARLWADGALQVVFIVLGVIGWWQWLRGGAGRTELEVGRASRTVAVRAGRECRCRYGSPDRRSSRRARHRAVLGRVDDSALAGCAVVAEHPQGRDVVVLDRG